MTPLILDANDLIKPAANLELLGPAFAYFSCWYILGALAFWLIGVETKGRSFEEIDGTMSVPAPVAATVAARSPCCSAWRASRPSPGAVATSCSCCWRRSS